MKQGHGIVFRQIRIYPKYRRKCRSDIRSHNFNIYNYINYVFQMFQVESPFLEQNKISNIKPRILILTIYNEVIRTLPHRTPEFIHAYWLQHGWPQSKSSNFLNYKTSISTTSA